MAHAPRGPCPGVRVRGTYVARVEWEGCCFLVQKVCA